VRNIKAGLVYFALVFGAGCVLGALRVTLIAPRVGARTAELIEMPIMLLVVAFTARWVVRRFRLPSARLPRLSVGLIALALLLAMELTVVLWLRGQTLNDYFAQLDPVAGGVYYAMLLVFAAMPALVPRR
jgi:hypothetical protein